MEHESKNIRRQLPVVFASIIVYPTLNIRHFIVGFFVSYFINKNLLSNIFCYKFIFSNEYLRHVYVEYID